MKKILLLITATIFLFSCSNPKNKKIETELTYDEIIEIHDEHPEFKQVLEILTGLKEELNQTNKDVIKAEVFSLTYQDYMNTFNKMNEFIYNDSLNRSFVPEYKGGDKLLFFVNQYSKLLDATEKDKRALRVFMYYVMKNY